MSDFLEHYLAYTLDTEATGTFHRWSAIVGVGAWLEKNVFIQHGRSQLFPNHYVMLLGESGTKKSSAIKSFVEVMRLAGYKTIAANKTSKEKFLMDLAAQHAPTEESDVLDEQLWGDGIATPDGVTPCLIAADEANDFFGIGNLEFLSILGTLWDFNGVYENKIKTGKSDAIPNPAISILSGNTPTNFSKAFPSDIIGQGFFSRLLHVHGEPTRDKITWPTPPTLEATAHIVQLLQQMKVVMKGELIPTQGARKLVDAIYRAPEDIADERFRSYHARRLTHLLKLSQVVAACKMEMSITEDTVIQANTYLTYIQQLMPKALGAYGKAQDSDVVQKVLSIIYTARTGIHLKDIFRQVDNDLSSAADLAKILHKLQFADKIQSLPKLGFLPLRKALETEVEVPAAAKYVDFNRYLTPEELGVKI